MTVSLEEAKNKLEELIDEAKAGEIITILREGQPCAEIVVPLKNRQAGSGRGTVWMAPDFEEPLEDFKDYM